ncbi:hypothetical protein ABKN59_006094 [Abortiporus biennis]
MTSAVFSSLGVTLANTAVPSGQTDQWIPPYFYLWVILSLSCPYGSPLVSRSHSPYVSWDMMFIGRECSRSKQRVDGFPVAWSSTKRTWTKLYISDLRQLFPNDAQELNRRYSESLQTVTRAAVCYSQLFGVRDRVVSLHPEAIPKTMFVSTHL